MFNSVLNDFKTKLQHPFSLIWKWGLVLSSLFWLALSVSPIISNIQEQRVLEEDYVTEVTQIDTYLQTYLNSLASPSFKCVKDSNHGLPLKIFH